MLDYFIMRKNKIEDLVTFTAAKDLNVLLEVIISTDCFKTYFIFSILRVSRLLLR